MHTSIDDGAANNSDMRNIGNQTIGVWHRPNSSGRERNLEELCAVIDEFKASGVNIVFLETFYHGKTVLKTDKVPYSSKIKDFSYGDYSDYLTAFVTEADKRGIDVFAWVQDFYVGVDDEAVLVQSHPDWMLINQSGELRHTTEGHGFGGYLFLDPANKEVRDFLADFYDELLSRLPQIKGLNLDYIRYPVSEYCEATDTGYTEITMKDFAEKCGISLNSENMREDLVAKLADENLYEKWVSYRADFITSFVKQVHDMLRDKYPGKLISTAVFPEIEQTYYKKKQNIREWMDNKYIDVVTPMVHFYDATEVYNAVKNLKSICGDAHCYTGLYTTYHNQTVEELAEHIAVSDKAGAEGFVLFDAAKTFFETTREYGKFLSETFGELSNSK